MPIILEMNLGQKRERKNVMPDNEQNKGKGLLLKIKEFFGYKTLTEFKNDWSALSDSEKEWFKTEVQKELDSDSTK